MPCPYLKQRAVEGEMASAAGDAPQPTADFPSAALRAMTLAAVAGVEPPSVSLSVSGGGVPGGSRGVASAAISARPTPSTRHLHD